PRRPGLERRLVSHPVKPVPHLRSGSDRRRLTDEDEKGGLEGVLGIVMILEDTPTEAPDHRAMSAHKRFQGRRLSAAHEALQQLPIGQIRLFWQQGTAKALDDLAHRAGRHPTPIRGVWSLYSGTTR